MKNFIYVLIIALVATSTYADPGRLLQTAFCYEYNSAGVCIKCYFRYVLKNGQCFQVSDYCKTWNDSTGLCTSCYDGWLLKNGACVLPSGCYERQVLINGKCVDVSDQCKTWNTTTGACTSCFQGWVLKNGACVLPTPPPPPPVCYYRQVPINGKCVNVSDLCKTWNVITGACTSCYPGYTLQSGGICKV